MRISDCSSDVFSSDLLDFGKIVVRVAVELHDADLDGGILALRPYLGQVEGVEPERLGLRVGHDLDEERPAREVAALDALEEEIGRASGGERECPNVSNWRGAAYLITNTNETKT